MGKKSDSNGKLGKGEYLEKLAPLQLELNDVARWLQHTGKRLVVLIEGRDTAGKGGVIAAIADTLNPRQCRIVALPKPTDRERTQWYSSVTCRTCRRPGRSRCSTAAGTTAPASNGSWATALKTRQRPS